MDMNDWTMMDFAELDYLCLPVFSPEENLVLDSGSIHDHTRRYDTEINLDLETLAEFPDSICSQDTSESFCPKPLKLPSEIEAPPVQTRSLSQTNPQPTAPMMPIAEPATSTDLLSAPTATLETEYTDYHDHIVKSLSIEQLKAIVAAYQLARWKSDLYLGCQAWMEKNPTASEAETRAVKTLLNPAHWQHTWLIVAAASDIVQRLSKSPKPRKNRRSSIHSIASDVR